MRKLSRPLLFVIAAVIVAAAYFGYLYFSNRSDGKLRASGTIEGVEVDVSPEMSGKVKEALAEEGQAVKTGDALLSLDDSMLRAQRDVAQAAVDSANNALASAENAYETSQAQYDATLTAARAQQGGARLADWVGRKPSEFKQPLWYFSPDEQIAAAQGEVDASQQALQQAQADLDATIKSLNNARIRLHLHIGAVINELSSYIYPRIYIEKRFERHPGIVKSVFRHIPDRPGGGYENITF